MTQIDFYILPQGTEEATHHFACRLIEKAVRQGNKVMVCSRDKSDSALLDKALWSFRPDAFVPHTVMGEDTHSDAPVVISCSDYDDNHHDVLINLKQQVPEQFSRFQRLAEVVSQNKATLESSRQRYAYYKSRGYPINTHKIK